MFASHCLLTRRREESLKELNSAVSGGATTTLGVVACVSSMMVILVIVSCGDIERPPQEKRLADYFHQLLGLDTHGLNCKCDTQLTSGRTACRVPVYFGGGFFFSGWSCICEESKVYMTCLAPTCTNLHCMHDPTTGQTTTTTKK